ncbi:MAG: hypothetical protein AB7O49_17125 [Sphingomonadales bacterium]
MQNLPGIAAVTALCALAIGAPSWLADGSLPSPFEVERGMIRQLVDRPETGDVKICLDADGRAGATINYDGNEGSLAYGDCVMVNARNVAIRTTDDLPKGAILTGVYAID